MSVHKAEPADTGTTTCAHCGDTIRQVPGGHGPTWVHDGTGCVAGGERKTYTLVIAASLVSTSQQDAWDTWAELLRDPLFVENNTTVAVAP